MKTDKNLTLLIWLLTIVLIAYTCAYFYYKCYPAALVTWIVTIGFLAKLRNGDKSGK